MNDSTQAETTASKGNRLMTALAALRDWVDARLPVVAAWKKHMSQYYAPKNFNFWYFFGVLSLLVLVIQLVSGIFLTMNYTPSAESAFASVEYIMRDVEYGWLLRYLHSTGASAFFIGKKGKDTLCEVWNGHGLSQLATPPPPPPHIASASSLPTSKDQLTDQS